MGPLRLRWNRDVGAPRRIDGALFAGRGRDPAALAADYVARNLDLLRGLVDGDGRDLLEPVAVGEDAETGLESIVFARYRDNLRVQSNHLEVFVTTSHHPWGQGIVARLRFQWNRDVETVGSPLLSREDAIAIAEDAFGRTLLSPRTGLMIECFPLSDRPDGCRPTWRVQDSAARTDQSDAVLVHAGTGDVLRVTRVTANFNGSVQFNSHFPYDTEDVPRDMRDAELRAFDLTELEYVTTELDDNGTYSWSPDASVAEVNLRSETLEIWHSDWTTSGCPERDEVPVRRTIVLGEDEAVAYNPDSEFWTRNDALAFGWLSYLRIVEGDHVAQGEFPPRIWFDARGAATCTNTICEDDEAVIEVSRADWEDDDDPRIQRYGTAHEYFHTVHACTEQLGAGCSRVADGNSPFSGAWSEGQAMVFGAWFSQYDNRYDDLMELRMTPYLPAAPDDVFIHDSDLGGFADSDGCHRIEDVCPSGYACWPDAHDIPLCMHIAVDGSDEDTTVDVDDCGELMPLVPLIHLDIQPYGETETQTDVPICVHNDYRQGRIFGNLMAQLLHGAGYDDALDAMIGANRDREAGTDFTQGENNFHDLFADHALDYEVSHAFHLTSLETFSWLDDVTNVGSHAEIMRTPRQSPTDLSYNPRSGSAPGFQSDADIDVYLLMGDVDATYQVSGDSSDADLCIVASDWMTNDVIATADGCTDGPEELGASLDVAVPAGQLVKVFVWNALYESDTTYSLTVEKVDDDYADSLGSFATAEPLGIATPVEATHETSTDADLFRYDVPLGQDGNVTFTTSYTSDDPILEVYAATGEDQPGGTPTTDNGSITITDVTGGQRYYVLVKPNTWSIPRTYQIEVEQDGCTSWEGCNQVGTWAEPISLPSPIGGLVWNALEAGNFGDENSTWANCADGTECDWYQVSLDAGERLTAATYAPNGNCNLDVSVFAPPEQQYWEFCSDQDVSLCQQVGYVPAMFDRNLEGDGLLSFVARRSGVHRIRVRVREEYFWTPEGPCEYYELRVAHGAVDDDQPPPIH